MVKRNIVAFTIFWIIASFLAACAAPPQAAPPPTPVSNSDEQILAKGIETLAKQIVASIPSDKKPLIAVLDFGDLEGKVSAFGRLVGEELITKLFSTRKVRVVERRFLEKAVAEIKFGLSGMVDEDTAKNIGRQVGADVIITGTITDLKTSIKINARMIAVETGDILAAAGVEVIQDKRIADLMNQILMQS